MISLKHIFPIDINFKIKNFFVKKNKCIFDNKESLKKFVYFLDAPAYGNIGDQAIAFAMEKFMKDYFPDYEQREIQEKNIYSYIKCLKSIIKEKDLICLTGGGNMGVLYQRYEAIRRIIIKEFPNNNIIIFPQTIDYGNTKYGIKELNRAKKIYNNHEKIIMMAREEKSYKIMKKEFQKCNIILCPDIVLYLNYLDLVKKRDKSIGICLRDDKEKVNIKIDEEKLNSISNKRKIITTASNNTEDITNKNRKKIIENKLKEIANNEYFITDRLHGMIFAYITNTNCIALPNSNGKVEGVYKWIKNKGKIKFEKKIDYIFTKDSKKNEQLDSEFSMETRKGKNALKEE